MCDKTFLTSSSILAVLEIKKFGTFFKSKLVQKKSFRDNCLKHQLISFIRSCFHESQICFTKFAACFDLKTNFCLRIKIFKKVKKLLFIFIETVKENHEKANNK